MTKLWCLPIWTLYANAGSSYWYRQSKCLHSTSDSLRMSSPPRVNAVTFSWPSQCIDDSSGRVADSSSSSKTQASSRCYIVSWLPYLCQWMSCLKLMGFILFITDSFRWFQWILADSVVRRHIRRVQCILYSLF